MCRQISLQDVALVLYDYFPDDCLRVRCALEAIAQREPDEESGDVDVSFAFEGVDAESQPAEADELCIGVEH